MENKIESKDLGRCVYVPALARKLIRNGHKIIDIKPNRQYAERTVFVFEDDSTFNDDLQKAIEDIKEKRERNDEKARLNSEIRNSCL